MRHAASLVAVSAQPRSVAGRRLTSIRARLRSHQLDAALAQGADPWSAADVTARAAQLSSLSKRRMIAAGIERLVALAEGRYRSLTPRVSVRRLVVLEQRESLLALAERLSQPAPVEVAVIAQLASLLSDTSSPVYAGGKHPDGLDQLTTRWLRSVGEQTERLSDL